MKINIYFAFENMKKVYFVERHFTTIKLQLNIYIHIFVLVPISNLSFYYNGMNEH